MPSDRLFPDADMNFRYSIDEIIAQVASEEIVKEQKERDRNKKS